MIDIGPTEFMPKLTVGLAGILGVYAVATEGINSAGDWFQMVRISTH